MNIRHSLVLSAEDTTETCFQELTSVIQSVPSNWGCMVLRLKKNVKSMEASVSLSLNKVT